MAEQKRELIGTPVIRPDGWGKVSGEARYVDDFQVPGLWVGGTVRSPVPRGRIKAIRRQPGFDWSRVVLVTAADLPGPNAVAMIRKDHPILAAERVNFVSEAIALIAAPDRATLAAALAAVTVEIEAEPPLLTPEDALAGTIVIWGADNILAAYTIQDGDPAAGFARAETIIEGTYRTGLQEHLYLETNGMIARPRAGGGIEVFGSLQCPYYIHTALVEGLRLTPEQVVVRQVATGGAFGGKEDYPSVLAMHAALLARRAGRPVKMVYNRTEDICATTKRHPSIVRHRTGVMADGTLVAAEIDLILDGGAYTTLSPVVLSRSILHAAGAYRIPNVALRGRAVATNMPPNGAFRGFGAPQSLFAIERQMDRIAGVLGIDPLDLRRRNLLRTGDRMPYGQILEDEVAAGEVLDRAVALSGYREKKAATQDPGAATRRGVGLSLYFHGGGFTGAGEERIAGRAAVQLAADGCVDVLVSNVEMGQGAATSLCMIAAQALGLPLECVRHPLPDTSTTPDTGPTVASRTTMIVGRIVIDACRDMLAKLRDALARRHAVDRGSVVIAEGEVQINGRREGPWVEAARQILASGGRVRGEAAYTPVANLQWDEEAYRGDAYKAYSWGADVVEVEVDPLSLEVRPLRATVVVEIGRAIHPVVAVGQVEGGTLQALGWGTMEEIKVEHGRFLNDRLATYIIPTCLDAPEMAVDILEQPYKRGPHGAKGLGELPMDGGAPALAAAIEDALDIRIDEIPATPERLLALTLAGPDASPTPTDHAQ